jgi:hypothetical protein
MTLLSTVVAVLLLAAVPSSAEELPDDQKGLVVVTDPPPEGILPDAGLPTGAVELQIGQQYASGTRVRSSADGLSFVIPEEWLGGLPPDAPAVVLGSNTRPGLGMIIMRSTTSWEEIESFLALPQDLGDGVVLSPTSQGQRTARGYEISLANTMYAGHAIGRMGDAGNGVIVFFGGPAADREYYARLTAGTAELVDFGAPRENDTTPQWRAYLAGMMLKRSSSYYSGGNDGGYVGGSSSQTLHLCSDGTYTYLSHSTVAADAGGGTSGYSGGDGAELGRWRVETIGARILLSLSSANGEVSQHVLQTQGNETYVDSERALRVQSDRCR